MNIAAYLDLLGARYTGAGPHALYLAQDKALAKKIFAFHGIQHALLRDVLPRQARPLARHLVPADRQADVGGRLDRHRRDSSVVDSVKELMERIHYIHEEFDSPALIEEYIEGREIYAAVLGNEKPGGRCPLVELDLSQLPEGTPRIAGHRGQVGEGDARPTRSPSPRPSRTSTRRRRSGSRRPRSRPTRR